MSASLGYQAARRLILGGATRYDLTRADRKVPSLRDAGLRMCACGVTS